MALSMMTTTRRMARAIWTPNGIRGVSRLESETGFTRDSGVKPRLSLPRIQVEENCDVGRQAAGRESIHVVYYVEVEASTVTLKRDRRVSVAIGDHYDARFEGGPYNFGNILCAVSGHQKEFRRRSQVPALVGQEHCPHSFAKNGPSRFSRHDDLDAAIREGFGQHFELGAFSATINTLECNEDALHD